MQPELRARVNRMAVDVQGRPLSSLLAGRRYVGIHIRRGDACPLLPMRKAAARLRDNNVVLGEMHDNSGDAHGHEGEGAGGRYCPRSLQGTYGYWLQQMRAKYGVDTVYLATDSSEAEQCAARSRSSDGGPLSIEGPPGHHPYPQSSHSPPNA